jgi:hypothetical protein
MSNNFLHIVCLTKLSIYIALFWYVYWLRCWEWVLKEIFVALYHHLLEMAKKNTRNFHYILCYCRIKPREVIQPSFSVSSSFKQQISVKPDKAILKCKHAPVNERNIFKHKNLGRWWGWWRWIPTHYVCTRWEMGRGTPGEGPVKRSLPGF